MLCVGVDLVGVLSALVNDISKPDIRMRFTASQPAQVRSPTLHLHPCTLKAATSVSIDTGQEESLALCSLCVEKKQSL